jgi:hypothetical protein
MAMAPQASSSISPATDPSRWGSLRWATLCRPLQLTADECSISASGRSRRREARAWPTATGDVTRALERPNEATAGPPEACCCGQPGARRSAGRSGGPPVAVSHPGAPPDGHRAHHARARRRRAGPDRYCRAARSSRSSRRCGGRTRRGTRQLMLAEGCDTDTVPGIRAAHLHDGCAWPAASWLNPRNANLRLDDALDSVQPRRRTATSHRCRSTDRHRRNRRMCTMPLTVWLR